MNLLSLPWQWGKKTTTKKTGICLLWPGYDLVWTLKMYKGLVWKCPRLFRSMWSNAVKEGCLKREAACTVVAGSPKTGGESGWLNVSYQVSVLCPPLGGPLGPGLQGLRNLISLSGQPVLLMSHLWPVQSLRHHSAPDKAPKRLVHFLRGENY